MEKAVPKALNVFRMGLKTKGLKIVFGTDAVAGSHGRNFQELVYRVKKGGQDPMQAITSATSLAAESLGLGDRIGSIAPGYEADLIAVDGDPLRDITTMERVTFVIKSGKVLECGALAPLFRPRLAAAAGSKLPASKRRQAAALQTEALK